MESMKMPPLSESKQFRINTLFWSRLKIVLIALVLQALTIIPLTRTVLLALALFNVPAIIALLLCIVPCSFSFRQVSRYTKLLLKIGIAKAVGSVLLAIYAGLKFICLSRVEDPKTKMMTEQFVVYLTGVALLDLLYTILAVMVIRRTKEICKLSKTNGRKERKVVIGYVAQRSLSEESSNSCSCSEEESTAKVIP